MYHYELDGSVGRLFRAEGDTYRLVQNIYWEVDDWELKLDKDRDDGSLPPCSAFAEAINVLSGEHVELGWCFDDWKSVPELDGFPEPFGVLPLD